MPDDPTRYVTHSEFVTFREDFRRFQGEVGDTLNSLRNMLTERGRTNWSVVIAALGTLLFVVSMSAALVGFLLNAEAQSRRMADEFTAQIVDLKVSRTDGEIVENAHELDLMWQLWFEQLRENGRESAVIERFDQHVLDEIRRDLSGPSRAD